MPMVYDLPTVEQRPLPMAQVAAPESKNFAADQNEAMGKAAASAGVAVMQVHNTMAEASAKQNDNELFDFLLKAETSYKQTTLQDAVKGREPVLKSATDKIRQMQEGIQDPLHRAMFEQLAAKRLQSFKSSVNTYALGHLKEWHKAEDNARTEKQRTATYNQWASWNVPDGQFGINLKDYENRIQEQADNAGISGDVYDQFRIAEMTKLHEGVLGAMMSNGQTKMAKEYYGKYLNDIDVDRRGVLENQLKIAGVATEGDDLAAKIWGELGPRDLNGAVPLFQMTQKARQLAGDNEDVQKAAIAGLKERAGEWNGEQAEFKAQNINSVWGLIDSGKSYKTSQAWLALTDVERHQIRKTLEEESNVRESRAAAQSQRELADLQRNELLAFLKNGDAYLTASDPNVLRDMTRAQVEAKRSVFGMSATQHLLDRWDVIQDPKRFGEVKMDSDDFNNLALSMNLDPYSKNPKDRAKVGALKFHVEQALDYEQRNRNKPMTRQEKMDFVKKEMSKQVLVYRPFWTDANKSALNLTNDQRKRVIVPEADRAKITEAMKVMYQKTGNAMYAPTEANLRREYLMGVSPGAAADFQEIE